MKRAAKWFTVLAVVCSMVVSGGCGAKDKGTEEAANRRDVPKIGLIVGLGGLGDGAFNDLAYNGTQMFEPGEVQVDVAEPKQVSDFQMLQQQFAESEEYAAIVCVGYDQSEALAEVATNFPEAEVYSGGRCGGEPECRPCHNCEPAERISDRSVCGAGGKGRKPGRKPGRLSYRRGRSHGYTIN